MTEYIQKVEEEKKRRKKSKQEQKISLEIFYNFDDRFTNNTINKSKKKKPIDEQAKNLDIYNAIMNNNSSNRSYRNINNDL